MTITFFEGRLPGDQRRGFTLVELSAHLNSGVNKVDFDLTP